MAVAFQSMHARKLACHSATTTTMALEVMRLAGMLSVHCAVCISFLDYTIMLVKAQTNFCMLEHTSVRTLTGATSVGYL